MIIRLCFMLLLMTFSSCTTIGEIYKFFEMKNYQFNGKEAILEIPSKRIGIKIVDLKYKSYQFVNYMPEAEFFNDDYTFQISVHDVSGWNSKDLFESYLDRYNSDFCTMQEYFQSQVPFIEGYKGKRFYVADYYVPEWSKIGIKARKIIAVMDCEDVIVKIELSKIYYEDSDDKEIQRILKSIEFVALE